MKEIAKFVNESEKWQQKMILLLQITTKKCPIQNFHGESKLSLPADIQLEKMKLYGL